MSVLDPIRQTAWNRATARHLLNRAGFGTNSERIDELTAMPPEDAVDSLLDFSKEDPGYIAPDWLPETNRHAAIKEIADKQERRKAAKEVKRSNLDASKRLREWWLRRMIGAMHPFQEKLALFWHGHFATSAKKVTYSYHNYQLNEIFRRHGLDNFKDLVFAVGKSPCMMEFLDTESNVKGRTNENWARELMELFTLGIGNYTEQDVMESSRAFTGWTYEGNEFKFKARLHDDGDKKFLDKNGNFDGDNIVNIIFEQAALAPFICGKIWKHFAHETADKQAVDALAKTFCDNKYDLRPVFRQLLLAQAFYDSSVMGTQIKSPAQLLVGLFDHLNIAPREDKFIVTGMEDMGQNLFFPPNVKGWEGNREWINTNTLLARFNIAVYLVSGIKPHKEHKISDSQFDPAALFESLQRDTVGETLQALFDRFLSRPLPDEKQTLLLRTLRNDADAKAAFNAKDYDPETLRQIVHLIVSTNEYQLC